jgi:uncharacterized protein (DUF1810 family)
VATDVQPVPAATKNDPYKLERFVSAQNGGETYARAVAELRRGRKTTHWMWFVFPQIAGLGHSQMSTTYAIASLDEAKAYLRHPVLGPRLIESSGLVARAQTPTAEQIFGGIDTQKLHSSMTLFQRAAPGEPLFKQVLDRFFGGKPDSATEAVLGAN